MAKKKKLTLKVLFDTNVIYTGSANDLLRKEIIELLGNYSTLYDIDIEWHIPEIVLKERIFQMNKKGNELLPHIQKLEKLLGHNLNINQSIIEKRIAETVKEQIAKLSLQTIKLETTKVNWETIIHNSVNRQPPFEDNEKEKGFRDALILECLKQTIESSPSTKSSCRIVFITNDDLLNEAANEATSSNLNVNVYSNIDELVSLINILNSEITEELINSIASAAGKIFFEKEDESTFYFTEGIRKKISDTYTSELSIKQEGVDIRENGTWWINNPGFVKKIKQRVFWKTIISIDFKNYKIIPDLSIPQMPSSFSVGSGIFGLKQDFKSRYMPIPDAAAKKEKIGEGNSRFEIMWSVTLTTTKKLIAPKLESIKYIDTINK